jgi:hypothetical protein
VAPGVRRGDDHGLAPLSPQERAKGWLLNSLQPSMLRNADSSVGY